MDPTAALAELRDMVTDLQQDRSVEVGRLIELHTGLDEWITSGGHLPEQWSTTRG